MEQFAGLVLLVLAVALFVNLVQGGPGQVKAWLSAKFLGKPLGA
jgi:hypothetical protein